MIFKIQLTTILFVALSHFLFADITIPQGRVNNECKDTLYYETGEVRAIIELKGSLLNGTCLFFFENGKLLASGAYKNGVIDINSNFDTQIIPKKNRFGNWFIYYKNGQRRTEKSYKNGMREGLFKEWYPNGQIMIEAFFEHGLFKGKCTSWYENGQIMELSYFANGDKDGISMQYYENGNLKEKGNYKKGIKIGKWEYWNANGTLQMTEDHFPLPQNPSHLE
ncbi:MAG: toxin-antitoxin system YwqK family antitoxin [Labilibaculum sp.]|nr:toxin-antitoxin system YwqK family antitoxin [Labilibaculum sp.]MBI9057881.1 toxin-antitoxin system YwqK family antitoxin [Labilibaculum sp.]